jgi:hypothetical protein
MKITRRKALAALAGIPALIADGSSAHHGAGGHPTFTPTNTNTPAVPTNTPTNTPVPPTNTPTNTPVPPTATFTPTFTPVPPTATFTPTPVACQNLIANSSFEVPSGTGAANWVRGVRDTTVFRTGVASLKNNWQGDLYARTDPFITLEPSKTYVLSGYVKTDNIGAGEVGAGIRYTVTSPSVVVHASSYLKGTNDWTFLSVQFTTAANYLDGRVDVHMVSAGGAAWWDDVEVRAIECAQPTPTDTPVPTKTPTEEPTATNTPTQTPSGWVDLGVVSQIAAIGTAWGKTVSALTPFQGRIFLGYGDYNANVPSVTKLIGWSVSAQSFAEYADIPSHAILDNKVIGNQLSVAYTDNNDLTGGQSHTFDNADMSLEVLTWAPAEQPIHTYASELFLGKRYLGGSEYVPHLQPDGIKPDQVAIWREDVGDPDGFPWHDVVVHGAHNDLYPSSYYNPLVNTNTPNRCNGLFVIGSTLYAGINTFADGGVKIIKTTDGHNWTFVTTGVTRMKKPVVVGGEAWFGNVDPGGGTSALQKFNGTTRTTVVSSGVWDHCLGDDGVLYYLNSAGQIKNAAGTTLVTAPANVRSIARFGGFWYIGTSDSHLWRRS